MGLCWILCLLLMLVSILSTGGVCPQYPVPKRADTTLHVAYLYQRITLGSLALCVNHCLRGTKCKSIAYTLTGECRLFTKSVEDDPSLAIAEIGTLYVSRSRLHSVKHVCLSVCLSVFCSVCLSLSMFLLSISEITKIWLMELT